MTETSVPEILEHALFIEKGRWTQQDQNRASRCLVSMGFARYRAREGGKRVWRYRLEKAPPRRDGPSGPSVF